MFQRLPFLIACGITLLFGVLNMRQISSPQPLQSVTFSNFLISTIVSIVLLALPTIVQLMTDVMICKRQVEKRFKIVPLIGRLLLYFGGLLLGLYGIMGILLPEQVQPALTQMEALNGSAFIVMALLLCGAIPVVEEFLFRGIIQTSLPRFGIPVSAALFAFAHGSFALFLPLFFFGFLLGSIAQRERSLVPGILLHGGFNLLNLLMT
ncbi:MAG: CPBP family intramembrane glutamic endopeptidase [Kiritimatiellia bacterium]